MCWIENFREFRNQSNEINRLALKMCWIEKFREFRNQSNEINRLVLKMCSIEKFWEYRSWQIWKSKRRHFIGWHDLLCNFQPMKCLLFFIARESNTTKKVRYYVNCNQWNVLFFVVRLLQPSSVKKARSPGNELGAFGQVWRLCCCLCVCILYKCVLSIMVALYQSRSSASLWKHVVRNRKKKDTFFFVQENWFMDINPTGNYLLKN